MAYNIHKEASWDSIETQITTFNANVVTQPGRLVSIVLDWLVAKLSDVNMGAWEKVTSNVTTSEGYFTGVSPTLSYTSISNPPPYVVLRRTLTSKQNFTGSSNSFIVYMMIRAIPVKPAAGKSITNITFETVISTDNPATDIGTAGYSIPANSILYSCDFALPAYSTKLTGASLLEVRLRLTWNNLGGFIFNTTYKDKNNKNVSSYKPSSFFLMVQPLLESRTTDVAPFVAASISGIAPSAEDQMRISDFDNKTAKTSGAADPENTFISGLSFESVSLDSNRKSTQKTYFAGLGVKEDRTKGLVSWYPDSLAFRTVGNNQFGQIQFLPIYVITKTSSSVRGRLPDIYWGPGNFGAYASIDFPGAGGVSKKYGKIGAMFFPFESIPANLTSFVPVGQSPAASPVTLNISPVTAITNATTKQTFTVQGSLSTSGGVSTELARGSLVKLTLTGNTCIYNYNSRVNSNGALKSPSIVTAHFRDSNASTLDYLGDGRNDSTAFGGANSTSTQTNGVYDLLNNGKALITTTPFTSVMFCDIDANGSFVSKPFPVRINSFDTKVSAQVVTRGNSNVNVTTSQSIVFAGGATSFNINKVNPTPKSVTPLYSNNTLTSNIVNSFSTSASTKQDIVTVTAGESCVNKFEIEYHKDSTTGIGALKSGSYNVNAIKITYVRDLYEPINRVYDGISIDPTFTANLTSGKTQVITQNSSQKFLTSGFAVLPVDIASVVVDAATNKIIITLNNGVKEVKKQYPQKARGLPLYDRNVSYIYSNGSTETLKCEYILKYPNTIPEGVSVPTQYGYDFSIKGIRTKPAYYDTRIKIQLNPKGCTDPIKDTAGNIISPIEFNLKLASKSR